MITKMTIFCLMMGLYIYGNSYFELIKTRIYINQMYNNVYGFWVIQNYPYIKSIYLIILCLLFISIVKDVIKKVKKEN